MPQHQSHLAGDSFTLSAGQHSGREAFGGTIGGDAHAEDATVRGPGQCPSLGHGRANTGAVRDGLGVKLHQDVARVDVIQVDFDLGVQGRSTSDPSARKSSRPQRTCEK